MRHPDLHQQILECPICLLVSGFLLQDALSSCVHMTTLVLSY